MNTVSRENRGAALLAKAAGPGIIVLAISPAALGAWIIENPTPESVYFKFSPIAAKGNSNNQSQSFVLKFRQEDDGAIQYEANVTSGMGGNWQHSFNAPTGGWEPGRNEIECRQFENGVDVERVQNHPIIVIDRS